VPARKYIAYRSLHVYDILCTLITLLLTHISALNRTEYLKKLNLMYADKYGYTLMKSLEREVGGDAGRAGLFMLGMKLKPYETVAKLIQTATKGFGTNELLLTCTLIRYQKMMSEVKVAFQELTGKSLEEVVRSETGGDYERILLEIIEAGE
jgi:hypothetical protein